MKYDKLQPIGELYSCLQGEGKYIGIPHILIRVSGCKLRCQFRDSFCDTPYASWKPEKGKFTLDDIVDFYEVNSQIKHTMITGGGPTSHPKLLKELCRIGKDYNHLVTIETEGSEFVQTNADCISLSPKLSNSTPIPGTYMPYIDREVTEKDRLKHEKWRCNYDAMEQLIYNHSDYQLKPVISSEEDLTELDYIQDRLDIPNEKVWLMPEGVTDDELTKRRRWLMEYATEHGYNFTDRLHIIVYGDKRGV
tara:strand:+ start:3011 stop:3760 length:750 start_codon:yes stop_codon:yes gene_type:complete